MTALPWNGHPPDFDLLPPMDPDDEPGEDAPADNPKAAFLEPEDRGHAVLSALGDVEYVTDLVRPGRIILVAAEEGSGKSYAIDSELGIRMAVAGGSFAGTWSVVQTGPVLVLSEMHSDDDYLREDELLSALDLERNALEGRYYRLPLMTAAGGRPALTVPEWRSWITEWLRDHRALLLVVDTATGATQVDPWGKAIQDVYAGMRSMLAEYPALAIVLVVHLKKPQGRGGRRLSEVIGEWGRWCDVVLMLEADGMTRTKVSTHKRVKTPRRIVATKAGGLLIDPQAIGDGKSSKVSPDVVVGAIVAAPGLSQGDLAKSLGVSVTTAKKYADQAEQAGLIYAVNLGHGKGYRLYPGERVSNRGFAEGVNPPALSNEHAGQSLDGGLEGSKAGTLNPPIQPIGLEGPGLDTPPSVRDDESGAAT